MGGVVEVAGGEGGRDVAMAGDHLAIGLGRQAGDFGDVVSLGDGFGQGAGIGVRGHALDARTCSRFESMAPARDSGIIGLR